MNLLLLLSETKSDKTVIDLFDKVFPLVGVLVGGFLTYGSVFLNFRYGKKQKILDKQLAAYEEITKTIVRTKLIFEENIGEIGKLSLLRMEKKITDEQLIESFAAPFDKILERYNSFYELYSFSFLIDVEIYEKLVDLHQFMSQALNPDKFMLDRNLDKLAAKFDEVLSLISQKLGVSNHGFKLNIPSPHKWANALYADGNDNLS